MASGASAVGPERDLVGAGRELDRQLLPLRVAFRDSGNGIREYRLVASVGLIEALGGGWNTSDLPTSAELQRRNLIDPRNF